IVGAMSGIALFTVLSAAGPDPLVWFAVVAGFVALLSLGRPVTWASPVALLILGVALVLIGRTYRSGDVWSPYYRVSTYVSSCGITNLNVDGIPHQALHPV